MHGQTHMKVTSQNIHIFGLIAALMEVVIDDQEEIITNTQRERRQFESIKKEKEFLEMSSIVEDTFIKQVESIFDDDDVLLHIQNKIGARASNVNANQSILALNNLNLSTINSNARPSGIINPNFLRQSIAKQGIVHSIYDEDTIINIINESMN